MFFRIKTQKFLLFLCIALVLATTGLALALCTDYYRPVPLMNYVSQEKGIYDTIFSNLVEQDCRGCHGGSTADRHHGVPIVVIDHLCNPCHQQCTIGDPDCVNGATLHRNCLTSGCHNTTVNG